MAVTNKDKYTGKGGSSAPNKNVWDPWDSRSADYDAQRHAWIVKNRFGGKSPFMKSRYGRWAVDPSRRESVLRSYDKGYNEYQAYLDSFNKPDPVQPDPVTPPTGGGGGWYGGGSPWGGGGGGGGGSTPDPRDPEAARLRRFASMAPHMMEGYGNVRKAMTANPGGMSVAPRTQWTGNQAAEAISKWNEFQQRRAQSWAGVPQNQGMSQRGRPTASRFNLGGNQLPTVRQQQWGSQGGNLSAALMRTQDPYTGPKG